MKEIANLLAAGQLSYSDQIARLSTVLMPFAQVIVRAVPVYNGEVVEVVETKETLRGTTAFCINGDALAIYHPRNGMASVFCGKLFQLQAEDRAIMDNLLYKLSQAERETSLTPEAMGMKKLFNGLPPELKEIVLMTMGKGEA